MVENILHGMVNTHTPPSLKHTFAYEHTHTQRKENPLANRKKLKHNKARKKKNYNQLLKMPPHP